MYMLVLNENFFQILILINLFALFYSSYLQKGSIFGHHQFQSLQCLVSQSWTFGYYCNIRKNGSNKMA